MYLYDDTPAQLENETGAHITIFARRQGALDEAREEILAASRDTKQEVRALSLDLGNQSAVRLIFRLVSSSGIADKENSLTRSSDPKLGFQTFCFAQPAALRQRLDI